MMRHQQISATLRLVTAEMQRQGLWQDQPPATEKLSSKLPFCVDSLTFVEWLQWVMFPKLVAVIETRAKLPAASNMAVMAVQAFKTESADTNALLSLITQLDKDLTL